MEVKELIGRIDRFVDGQDRTLLSAQMIEVALSENFPGNEEIDEVVVALAMYTPGGGQYLLNEQDLLVALRWARKLIVDGK